MDNATPQQSLTNTEPANPSKPVPPQSPTSGQIIGKRPHFHLPKIIIVALVIGVIIFAALYASAYYLLNKQLDAILHRNISPTPISTPVPTQEITTTPTCTPRPLCLDTEPHCLLPETSDMCPKTSPTQTSIACTQEAKQCPDGSYVGRTGPNCEFSACPN